MTPVADALAGWATAFEPSADDLALADRALVDTIAVAVAARHHPIRDLLADLPPEGAWAALAHVLDFDDLHLPTTTHVSAVCVPAVLAAGGDARAYLAGAGAMVRLGVALGWPHYEAGWHATCTAGAPGAAVAAAVAMGLGPDETATSMALAVPAAGGVQRAFGTTGKALQVGFAVHAGVRAARLAAAGATADPYALDQWLALVGGDAQRLDLDGPAVPGGLAIKLFPCCYALQRPIAAVRALGEVDAERVAHVVVRTPAGALAPLIHSEPSTGLQGKFSLEYAVAATLLDGRPGIASFTDEAVARPAAQTLLRRVEADPVRGGDWLLAGEAEVEVTLDDGAVLRAAVDVPPGAPQRPPSADELTAKVVDCAGSPLAPTWQSATGELSRALAPRAADSARPVHLRRPPARI
jgi:2-methylcitrate dehydratase PrpD